MKYLLNFTQKTLEDWNFDCKWILQCFPDFVFLFLDCKKPNGIVHTLFFIEIWTNELC
ncbi:hypothetical protein C2G38_2052491 [Gigaspora rosea]|uniref:Uncharacterized protein n=1 Tax=Gigaspora rosea TaxID=44941 RepID=A0A397W9G5_9GLOM|nr:hypothetical protein C2G38_2052491 [Gigaspora rosea]